MSRARSFAGAVLCVLLACGACGSRTESPSPEAGTPAVETPLPTLADVEAARTRRAEQTREAGEWLSVVAAYAVREDEVWRRSHPDPKAARTEEEWEADLTRILPSLTRHPALPVLAATEAALRRGDEAGARKAWADAQARMKQAEARIETIRRLAKEHGLAR